jgi:tetratricopeptide (TPR) repeat protein
MMSTTLNLVDYLLNRGRYFQQIGHQREALRTLSRLAGLRELPAPVAEETQYRLGELQLRRRQYPRARRHLTAALRYTPNNARYHFLLAQALDTDRDGDPARALDHYQTSLQLDRTQTDCLCGHGLLALRMGQTEQGLRSLRTAVDLAPDDLKVLRQVVSGLRLANRSDEARRLLLAARFRQSHDSRYQKLWNDFQFHYARRKQDAARRQRAALDEDKERPVLLPFVRPTGSLPRSCPVGGRIIRHDPPASPAPHQAQPDKRHAQ